MGLVWQCARCNQTDGGVDDQKDGRQPPEDWPRIYVPIRGSDGARSHHQDVICDTCEDALYEWFQEPTS